MDFKKLTDKAKDLVDKRGGTDSLKEDAEELKGIASSKGSLSDKAKAAVEAIKDPGADDPAPAQQAAAPATPAADATPADAERAAEKIEGEERGKHGHGQGGHGRGGGRRGGGGGRGQGGGRGRRDDDPAV